MKIGILTFHRALNYGAVLQCYALYETLKDMGHDVEVIDYRPPYIEKYRKYYNKNCFHEQSIIRKIKALIKLPLTYWHIRKAVKAFDDFTTKHFCFSNIVNTAEDIPTYYDAIIFGSDQIWSPQICEGFDPIYWGQFSKGKTRFVTYAVSYGGHNKIGNTEKNLICQYARSFNRISVREKDFCNEISLLLKRPIPLVVDPTLLLRKKKFCLITIKPKFGNYVLLFMLEQCNGAEEFAKRIATERNCNVIRLTAFPHIKKKKNEIILKGGLSPEEFLGYFKYANFIVSVSFHGTAFSVIFRKDFYVIHSRMEDRAHNLLKSIGLEKRLVNPKEINEITAVDYTNVDDLIVRQREESVSFLKNNI